MRSSRNSRLQLALLTTSSLLATASCWALPAAPVSFPKLPRYVEPDSVHNIHVLYHDDDDKSTLDGELSLVYGPCNQTSSPEPALHHHLIGSTHIGRHPLAARHTDWPDQRPARFVWITPSDAATAEDDDDEEEVSSLSSSSSSSSSCVHAFVDGQHVGRSDQVRMVSEDRNPERRRRRRSSRRRRRSTFADVADPMGPWFDGVAYLKQKQPNETFLAATKNKRFGILGAGMAGLTTAIMLDSVGVHNWHILESSSRLGGRVRTAYLNNTTPDEGQYHEMGPMRFPYSITDETTNETYVINDQQMVFQLGAKLNALNAARANNSTNHTVVEFIPWIQSSPNTPVNTQHRRPDGTFPGKTEVATQPEYAAAPSTYSNATAAAVALAALDAVKDLTSAHAKAYATDVFRAHKAAVASGVLMDFSEVEYLRHVVGLDANTTDEVTPSHVAWPMWEYETVYFFADQWRTVKGGLSQLAEAFRPLVGDRLTLGAKVFAVAHHADNQTLSVSYRAPGVDPRTAATTTTETFDYVFNSVPFNLLKFWDALPAYSSLLRRAIDRTVFGGAAKVAIQYRTRWWEAPDRAFRIEGGCGRVTEPGFLLGQICYPSWDINATAGTPGVLMASYLSDYDATVACAMSEEQHIAHVQRAIVAIHGDVAERAWTGNYARHCWEHDEHHAGAFALPIVPQQQLYLPAFFQTEFGTVFIGEHTSYTHSWVFSALESAARGTVQMLLDLGLVDEAKQINEEWMARWIHV